MGTTAFSITMVANWDSKEQLENDLAAAVYKASVVYYEGAEHRSILRGNGHQMAQSLAEEAVARFRAMRKLDSVTATPTDHGDGKPTADWIQV